MATSPKTRASLSTRFTKASTTSGVRLRSQKFSAYWEPQTQNGEVWSCLDCIPAGLRERAPHHRSKGKGRSSQRASNSLSFHSLRHTAVSLLKDAGIPESVVMELVGHDSKSMSAHYTHAVEALEKAVAALPEI